MNSYGELDIHKNDRNMLERVWDELEHRLDVCQVTNAAHIEHFYSMKNFGVWYEKLKV
jgi:hypothetical protein